MGTTGEIWSADADGGELSWAECSVGKVVWHSETCAGKLREGDCTCTRHQSLQRGNVEKFKKKSEFSCLFRGMSHAI